MEETTQTRSGDVDDGGRGRWIAGVVVAVMTAGAPEAAAGQARIPDEYTNLQILAEDIERPELMGIMRSFTSSLGVGRCSYCHTVSDGLDQPDDDFASDAKSTKVKARAMFNMVQAINAEHIEPLPSRGDPPIVVTCVTCHSGVSRPTTLVQEMTWALDDGGVEEMRARYDELRERYYGNGVFDFGPRSLESVAESVSETDPAGAMAVLDLNLEHHPEAVRSWLLKGQLHGSAGETEEAIEAFERSLEIVPGIPFATQQLERLRGGGAGR